MSRHQICQIVLSVILMGFIYATEPDMGEVREYCQWKTMNATCPPDHVVMMTSARYGRMRLGTCLERDYYIGCVGDVLTHTDARCSGRYSCQVSVPDQQLHDLQPCPEDLGAYLEASYTCVPVLSGEGRPCHAYQPLPVTLPDTASADAPGAAPSSGYVSSVVTDTMGLGTSYCPWQLRTHPGQRLNLTLYDFNALHFDTGSARCQVYATIKQSTHTRDVTVCGGGERIRHVLLSDASSIEIHVTAFGNTDRKPFFLIKYEVVGCPNIAAPPGGWLKRKADTLVVGCNGTTFRSHLVCKGTEWVGDIRNCTNLGSDAGDWGITDVLGGNNDSFPYGLLISIAIGVLLGILLGVLLLAVVLACRKKKMNPHEAQYRSALMATKSGDGAVLPLAGDSDKYHGTATRSGGPYAHIWEMGYNDTEIIHTMDTLPVRKTYRTCDSNAPSDYCSNQQTIIDGEKVVRPLAAGPTSYLRTAGRDHVYESPQMKRKDGEEEGCTGHCPGPYYHEFDPTSTQLGCDGRPVSEVTHWSGGVDGIVPGSTITKD